MNKCASRTPAWLHALRLAFPPVVTLVLVVLTEWIARGSLTVDTLTQYIFPHAEAYLLAWALLFLIWLMVDWLTRFRCDCGEQLHKAMEMIDREGRGAVVYLNQEGRGIGLCNKIHAYKLQDEGLDTVDANLKLGFKADERDYGVGASIIRELGIRHMRLMTNNPLKRAGLEGYGLCIDEIVPIVIAPNPYNAHYLETKQERMHHTLGLEKR